MAGLPDEAMELEVIAERGAERIDGIRSRSVLAGSAGKPRRRIFRDSGPVPYGCPGRGCSLKLAGAPGCRDAIGGRQSIGRKSGNGEMAKWRRKCLERLDSRPEMAPAPGPSIRKPAACSLRCAAERPNAESPGVPKAAHAGAVRHPGNFAPRRPSPQAMGGMLAGRRRRRDAISGVEFFCFGLPVTH